MHVKGDLSAVGQKGVQNNNVYLGSSPGGTIYLKGKEINVEGIME
jgi:hypothetical protein